MSPAERVAWIVWLAILAIAVIGLFTIGSIIRDVAYLGTAMVDLIYQGGGG